MVPGPGYPIPIPRSYYYYHLPTPLSFTHKATSPSFTALRSRRTMATSQPQPKHIVICGGGVIGACTAYFLSLTPHTSITLLEKCAPACAASGKAGGFLALDWCDAGPVSGLARESFRLHRALAERLDGEQVYGYRALTTLSVPVLPERMPSSSSSSLRGSGLLPDWVDGETARPAKQIGTTETTAQVHPRLFTQTLISASQAKVIKGEVETIMVEDGRATGVILKESKEVIPADAVVLALGPWSSRLSVISELFSVSGLKAHSIVLRPREPNKITPHALFLSYQPAPGAKMLDPEVYSRPTGEVYICGMSKDDEVPEDPETIAGEPESIEMLHKIAGTVSSHLQKDNISEVVAEQACFLPCTDDGLPVIGELPGIKNCYVGTGHSCWGILNGPATGSSLAELILERKSKTVDLKPFTPARFIKRRTRSGV